MRCFVAIPMTSPLECHQDRFLAVATVSSGSRLCENTAEQFKTCGLKQYESIVDFHDRQPSFGRVPSNSIS